MSWLKFRYQPSLKEVGSQAEYVRYSASLLSTPFAGSPGSSITQAP
jgi:hypothetical protein